VIFNTITATVAKKINMHAQYLYYSSTKNKNASGRSISVLFGKTSTGSILSDSD
jgi:predicted phage tail protein